MTMADDAAGASTTPPATEAPAPSDSAADSEVEAQDPSTPAAPVEAPEAASAGALSSLSLAAPSAPDGGDAPPPPPAEPLQPSPPSPPPQQPPAVAQHLPLNLPAADLDELDDEDAAELVDNEFLSLLPPCVLPRVDKLKDLNDKRDEILDEYRKERAALEAKYGAMMKPLYEERRGVVAGEFDKAIGEGEEEDAGEGAEEGVVEDVEGEGGEGQEVKGIPQFWACAMGHVDVIAELITEGKYIWHWRWGEGALPGSDCAVDFLNLCPSREVQDAQAIPKPEWGVQIMFLEGTWHFILLEVPTPRVVRVQTLDSSLG